MKKRILLITAIGGFVYLTLSSESAGPIFYGNSRTGAKGTSTTCGGSTSCHGGTSSNTQVHITVDSGTTSIPVTKYVGGHLYTINISGTNSNSNPKFGFEFVAVSGTGSSQVQAGTVSSLPSYVHSDYDAVTGLNIVEHNAALIATTPGVYSMSFQWTAPATGTGTVTLYCTLNALDATLGADVGDLSNNTSVALTEESTSVPSISESVAIKAYPNPFTNQFILQMNHADEGNYHVKVFDISGKAVFNESVQVSGGVFETGINTSNWTPGFYGIQVTDKNGAQRIIPLIKQ